MGRKPKNTTKNTAKNTSKDTSNTLKNTQNATQDTSSISLSLYKYSPAMHNYSIPVHPNELKSPSMYTLSHLKFIDKMSKMHNSMYKPLSDFTIICPLCEAKIPASQGQIDINIAYINAKTDSKTPPDHLIVCPKCSTSEWKKAREAQCFRVEITKK